MFVTPFRSSVPLCVAFLGLVGCDCGAASHGSDAGMDVDAAVDVDASGSCTPVSWTVTPVDEGLPVDDAVLAIDEPGAVHFAYSADTGDGREIRHAAGAPGAWEITPVHSAATDLGGRDEPLDLAVQGSTPHVVFRGWRGGDSFLVHARRDSDGSWTPTDIERLGGDPSVVVDAAGIVHVAYVYFSGWQLRYARRELDGSWNISMLEPGDYPDRWPALASGRADAMHLLFGAGDSLYHAPAFTDAWAPTVVEPTWTATRTSIAIDGEGGVHLVYGASAASLPALVHGYLPPGGEWSRSPIDPGDEAVFWPGDLTLDAGGAAHLVYTRTEPGVGMQTLRYGHRPPGGSWTTEEAFAAPTPGRTRSLAVDTSGGIHVALFGSTGVHHAYMRRCP